MKFEKQVGISKLAELGKNVLGRVNIISKSPGGRRNWGKLKENLGVAGAQSCSVCWYA